jgi:hypothetical protein
MIDTDADRRTLLKLLGMCAVATVTDCAPRETPREGLLRLLDLKRAERDWLDVLSSDEQRELYGLLTSDPVKPRAIPLLARVLGSRSHVLAFVDYPSVRDQRSVCDGLIRE